MDPKGSVDGLKNLLPFLEIVPQLFGCPAYSVVKMLTELSWLSTDQLVMSQGIISAYSDLSIFMNVQFLVKLLTLLAHFI
jgi:hypothetical protein